VGQVISLGQMLIANSFSYDSLVSLDSSMRSELHFWKANIDALNLRRCIVSNPQEVLSIFGDASSTGYGSFIKGRDVIAAKTFSSVERDAHSTWRELENINCTLKAFLPFVRDRTVKFFVDNLACVTITANGSMKPSYQDLALQIYETCFANRVSLNLEWISRGQN
jgi:hypothetical protein